MMGLLGQVALQAVMALAVVQQRPNIVFILVDDLGFAGVGFNSPLGEPKTPTIDALAAEGAILTRHYTYQFCSPTRSSFLSGRLPIHVNQINHPPCELGGGVPPNMTTIADVLHRAGYATHHAGKWHGGMSRHDRLPINRGFDSSLAMLSGAADHFTNERACGKGKFVDMWLDTKPARGLNGTYSEYQYVHHALQMIQAHDVSKPFFLYMAFQNVHGPTEAPDRFMNLYNSSIFLARHKGLAQISAVDEGIANLTAALKAKQMWENTLVVFSSDNGGPADHEPNFPLRGSKGSDFEGGVRTVAFVTGGWLPSDMRGTKISAMMHITDWYSTFASLAGQDPEDKKAARASLPPIDSINMESVITGRNKTSPRTELALSYAPNGGARALIQGRYKIVVNDKILNNGFFPGPTTPNGTAYSSRTDCTAGCLFDLDEDEVEHDDLAATKPELLKSMRSRLDTIGATVYQSPGGGPDPEAVSAAREVYGGFWGPWEGLSPSPSPTPPVKGAFYLKQSKGNQCLRAASLNRGATLSMGACDAHAQWSEDDAGHLYNVAAKDQAFKFLRPSDHYPSCSVGHGSRLGELTNKAIGTTFNGDQLRFVTCTDKCVGDGSLIAPCGQASSHGWQKQPVSLIV